MENKKININQTKLSNSIIGDLNVPKKNNSTSFTMNPQMAKLFISGILKKSGMSDEKLKEALDVFDSKINETNPKKEKSVDVKKEIKDHINTESNNNEKGKDDISRENKYSNKSLESTK